MDDQTSIHFFAHPLPGGEQQFLRRIEEAASNLNRNGHRVPVPLQSVGLVNIKQIAVGPNHAAFLLNDGRVARLGLSVFQDRLDLSGKDDGPGKQYSCRDKPSGGGTGGEGGASAAAASRTAKIRRVMMAARRPGRSGVIVGSRPMIPASAIPEELVAQAQVVLQGKSRDVIVRELQRTNLNVNEAVNNLLSRDDDEGDELDEAADAYLPEELLTLLDAGLQSGEHGGVVLDADALYSGDGFEYLVARDMARRKMERDKEKDRARTSELAGNQHNYGNPITPGASFIYWTEMDERSTAPPFIAISALYSELLALGEDGRLYSWPWNQERAQGIHPKAEAMGFHPDERITALTTCMTRCALVTDKHRVASFVDIALGVVASSVMDAPAYDLGEMPVSIHVCPLYACARTAHGGSVYWWGVFPFNERRKKWEKLKSRSKKHVTFDMNEIKEGCEVRTKSNPIYSAGALAVNFSNGHPQVGELMEAAWTLTETCRFRVRSTDQLKTPDGWKPVKSESAPAEPSDSSTVRTNVRKRPADNESSAKEEAWALKDVIFVDEGKSQDAGVVEIVDGAYCGVVFAKDLKQQGAESSGGGVGFEDRKKAMRLLRKDDLQIISMTAVPRSPESFQRLPKKLALPHAGKGVIDLMVDSNGIRVLFERHGKIRLMRLSVFGKIASDHELPLVASAFFGTGACTPKLENYGDESVCVLRDGNGCVVPMLRDSIGGFREPAPLSLAAVPLLAVGIQPLLKSASTKFNRLALSVATVRPQNLMQLVQFCDVDSVKSFVNELEKEQNLDKAQAEILNARVDGNRNILHVALLSAVGATNKEHVDSSNPPLAAAGAALVDQDDLVAAGLARDAYEARWQQMVTRRFGGRTHPFGIGDLMMSDRQQPQVVLQQPPPPAVQQQQQQQQQETPASPDNQGQAMDDDARTPILVGYDSPRPEDMQQKTASQTANAEHMDTLEGPKIRRPVSDSKQRQRNALEIIKFLCEHPLMNAYMFDLLSTRDITGQTPFMLAVHARAYSAGMTMWETAQKVAKSSGQSQQHDTLRQMIFPPGSRPSDSPLFALSYNDTCSFTWTGDEHINQDIFECRTCGLVGSLCCCSECAYICHKNHDCKLKRTSPTAYCDCWEKCACKALVAGNQNVRFDLFNKLIQDTNLVTKTNARGEHLLLFLARTVGRQTNEQKQYNGSRSKARKTDGDMSMPEHDLEPPKFARKALERLLSDWSALKSMIILGVKQLDETQLIDEDRFYLNSQDGVSYLDRFVFTLLSRCAEQNLDTLLSTMTREVQRVSGKDEQADFVVGRFVRSVVRVFVVVSTCSNQKDQRRKAALSTTLKCRRVMQALITFALDELGHAADATIAPVRMGLVKPTHAFSAISSSLDAVDALEKLFASEPMFSSGVVGGASTVTSSTTNQPAPTTTTHSAMRRTTRMSSSGGRRSSSNARTAPSEARRTTFEFDDFDENDDDSSRRPSHGDDGGVLAAAAAAGAVPGQEPASLLAPLAGSDNESDSESEGEIPSSRTEQNSADSAAIGISSGHPPTGVIDITDASQQRRRGQQESNTDDSGQGSRMWSLDDAMEDDSRDYYYSDGESVDSVSSQGQNPEDDTLEDNGDDDGEDGDDTLGRDGIVNDPDDDGDRDDDGDSDHDSDSDRDSFATQQSQPLISVPPTLSQAAAAAAAAAAATNSNNNNANVPNPMGAENAAAGQLPTSQAQLLQAQSIAAQRSAAAAQNPLYRTTRTTAAPTLTWAVRRMSRSGTSMLSSSAIAPLATSNTQATNAAGQLTSGTVPPPERGGGSFYIVDTSLPPPSVRYHQQQQQQGASALADASQQLGQAALDTPSTTNTSAMLGRTFAILIRQIADLLPILADYKLMAPSLKCVLVVPPEESTAVRDRLENRLKTTWAWLFSALDTLEAQLRFGHALLGSQDHQQMFGLTTAVTTRQSTSAPVGASSRPAIPQRYGYGTSADGEQMHSGSARKDFVGYLLSLMRAHSSEHGDDLPVIDYGSLRPVAHIVDSLFALMDAVSRADTPPPDAVNLADLFDQFADQEGETSAAADLPNEGSMRRFFQRSKSLLYPGVSTRLGAFDHSIGDSLPLAEKPHLLRPETSKERMFGVPGRAMIIADHKDAAKDTGNPNPTHQSLADPMASGGRVGSGGDIQTTPTQSTSRAYPTVCPDTPVTSAVRTVLSSTVDLAAAASSPTKRPNVIVHAKSATADKNKSQKVEAPPPPPGVARVTLSQIAGLTEKTDDNGAQILMGRWKRSLTLLAKVFHEDLSSYVPSEQSVLAQMAGFVVRESKFRKEMERLRGAQSKDLVLEVDRERHMLIQQTIKQLNQAFQRRSSCAVAGTAPLAVHKVKVTFKEEPGEGTGVARSFYAAVAEAFLTIERLPNLELCQATPGGPAAGIGGRAQQQHFLNRMRTRERTREFHRRRTGTTTRRYPLSADAPPFYLSGGAEEGAPVTNWDPSKQTLGERLFPRVRQLRPSLSNKITGMLLELPPHQLIALLTSEESLRAHVEDAVDQITASMNPGDIRDESSQDAMDVAQNLQGQDSSANAPLSPSKSRKSVSTPNLHGLNQVLDPDEIQDSAPLFYQPGKAGFYSPVPGKNSTERINAFRNVGRLMGICLLQNELLPIHLCRHVFKYILDRPINWYDLAFFDPSLFESLRSLATHDRNSFEDLHLTFSINVAEEEGGGVIDLKANGSNITVIGDNVVEYVYRYVEMRMLKNAAKALEAMKQGVYDVLPSDALKGLTAEDLRLILCGTHEISIRLLQSYTSFADESSAPADQLARFKRWFWYVVSKLNAHDRQDLVYFWTGSPALPSSEEGFQPLPSVMIRPADDHHLPTANTCISRLYLPLYSSKKVLKQKLAIAIKARTFGFV